MKLLFPVVRATPTSQLPQVAAPALTNPGLRVVAVAYRLWLEKGRGYVESQQRKRLSGKSHLKRKEDTRDAKKSNSRSASTLPGIDHRRVF